MKIENNIPIGLGWQDDNGNQNYGKRGDSDSPITGIGGKEMFPSVNNDPLEWYYRLIQDMHKYQGFSDDQLDAYGNNILQLIIRQQDWQRQSPAVQIQRLMATGMSRAAAMQLLNSAGVGSTGGSSVSPQMAGNKEQSVSERLNAVNGSIQAASQLMQSIGQLFMIGSQMGLNKSTIALQAQQALLLSQQSEALQISNEMTRAQYDALGDAATALQVLSNYKHKNPNYEVPSNINDWLSYCEKTPDAFLQYWSKEHMQKLKNPYYYAALKKSYEEYVKGDFDLQAYRRQTMAQARMSELGVDGVVAEIANINQNTENAQETWQLIKEEIRGYQAANEYQEQVNDVLFSSVEDLDNKSPYRVQVEGQGYMQYCAGLLAAIDYNIQKDYRYPIIIQDAMYELESWEGLTQEEVANRKKMFVQKRENQEAAMWLLSNYYSNLQSGRENWPGTTAFLDVLKSYDVLSTLIQAGTSTYNTSVVGASMLGGSAIGGAANIQASKTAGTGVQAMKDAAFVKTVVKGFK